MSVTPTQNSVKLLRSWGFIAEVVEKWIHIPGGNKIRKDLFGFADVLAVRPGYGIWLVQSTSKSNLSARVRKIRESPFLPDLLGAGVTVEVHGWHKVGNRWHVRRVLVKNPLGAVIVGRSEELGNGTLFEGVE